MELSIRDERVKLAVLLAGLLASYLLRSLPLLFLLVILYVVSTLFSEGGET